MKILEVNNLSLSFKINQQQVDVLKNISFSLEKGKTLGIVGESGSGKSITALSILKLLPKNAVINSGEINFINDNASSNLLSLSEKQILGVRGSKISMIFQEPMTSLNPSLTCGYQVSEIIRYHLNLSENKAKERTLDLFKEVKLPDPKRLYLKYPHEISGGQKQRVMIAMAIALNPAVLIADEPTTALDVTVQKSILELLKQIQKKYGTSIIFISHDLGVISNISDDIAVMYKGDIVEYGSKVEIIKNPQIPYTIGLLKCRPTLETKKGRLPVLNDFLENRQFERKSINTQIDKSEDIILRIQNLDKIYFSRKNFFGKYKEQFKAVNNISFDVFKGETLGLVGESGCGKTTLGRTLVQLIEKTSGDIYFKGKAVSDLSAKELKEFRKKVQIIFQDPYSSLNPKLTIGDTLLEVLNVHNLYSNKQRRDRVVEILEKVKLEKESFYKYPHEFSGGQRQRIVIARALILEPEFIICDESVSALDVSVQAEILNLLNDLRNEFGLTYIFISHDLSVVKYMSDRVLVMKDGKLVELKKADEIYNSPASEYTKSLICAIHISTITPTGEITMACVVYDTSTFIKSINTILCRCAIIIKLINFCIGVI